MKYRINKKRRYNNLLTNDVCINRQWMYLEPIFTSEDIKVQLPAESKKYGAMERAWKRIMRNAFECRKVNCEI